MGEQYWKLRKTHKGPERKFRTAKALWDACVKYFEWIEANPLMEEQAFAYQGDVTRHDRPLMRAMTITGLCLHLGIPTTTWRRWRKERQEEDWQAVMLNVEEIIWEQKFTGAAAGLLKENIISRELGLQEHVSGKFKHKADIELGDATKAYLQAINGDGS